MNNYIKYILFLILIFLLTNNTYSQVQSDSAISLKNTIAKQTGLPDEYHTSFSISAGIGNIPLNQNIGLGLQNRENYAITKNWGINANVWLKFISKHLFLNVGYQSSSWALYLRDIGTINMDYWDYIDDVSHHAFFVIPNYGTNLLQNRITLFLGLGMHGTFLSYAEKRDYYVDSFIGESRRSWGFIATFKAQYNITKLISAGTNLYDMYCNISPNNYAKVYKKHWYNMDFYVSLNL